MFISLWNMCNVLSLSQRNLFCLEEHLLNSATVLSIFVRLVEVVVMKNVSNLTSMTRYNMGI